MFPPGPGPGGPPAPFGDPTGGLADSPAPLPPVPPPAPPVAEPLTLPPLTDDQRVAVKGWIAAADQDQKRYTDLWKKNLDAYAPPPEDQVKERGDYQVNTNVDFRQAEQKKAQLWFDTATVQLTPVEPLSDSVLQLMQPQPAPGAPPAPGQPPSPAAGPAPAGPGQPPSPQPPQATMDAAIQLHETILNTLLGPDEMNVKRTIQSAVLDCLVPSGWGVTHIGYTAYTHQVPTQDPMTGEAIMVPVPVYEEYYWSRLSPSSLRVPSDFKSTDLDKAPWLALKLRIPLSECRREYGAVIPEDFRGGAKNDPDAIRGDERSFQRNDRNSFDPYVDVVQVYYYAPTLDPQALHPKRVCELVLIEGIETEVRHRYCPYQSLDDQGRLTPDSMQGYPIHVLFLRDVPDDNHVPSDSSMTRALTDELNQYRSQILKSRDASIPYSFYDKDILPPETIERITNGDYGPLIPVEAGRLNAANPPVMAGNKPQLSRETYAGQDVIERDLERTLAIGSNQTGATNDTRRTATEVQTMQNSVDTRLAGEQQQVVSFFVRGVRKLDALVQRFSDREQVVMLLGDDGARTWLTWDKRHIAGRFAYTIKPDSQVHVDAAADRQQDLAFYNLTARDPFINRQEMARRLASKWGYNPDKLVVTPPPPGPPPPNVQVRVQGADLDPRLPQFPFVLEILQQSGYQISADTLQNAVLLAGKATAMGSLPDDITPPAQSGVKPQQPAHPGAAEQSEPISKHHADLTGNLPGGGAQFGSGKPM